MSKPLKTLFRCGWELLFNRKYLANKTLVITNSNFASKKKQIKKIKITYLLSMLIAIVLNPKPMKTKIGWTISSKWKAIVWYDAASSPVIK